jgi:hypothetical protein
MKLIYPTGYFNLDQRLLSIKNDIGNYLLNQISK